MTAHRRSKASAVRGRKRRDGNATMNSRAVVTQTVSGWSTGLEVAGNASELVVAGPTPKTPLQLRHRCAAQGGKIKYKGSEHYTITHPNGRSFEMLQRWKWTQDRQQALKAARNAGFIVDPIAVVRPNIEETEMPTIGETVSPIAIEKATHKVLANKHDVDVLFEMVRLLEKRIDELSQGQLLHDARIDHLREEFSRIRALGGQPETSKVDKFAVARAEILDVFSKLPPGWRVTASSVAQNLNLTGSDAEMYQRQVRHLAKNGALIEHRSDGPGPVHFSLAEQPVPTHDYDEEQDCAS